MIDRGGLKDEFGGEWDVLESLIERIASDFPDFRKKLKARLSSDEYEEAAKQIHQFKGRIGYLQSKKINARVIELETLLRSKEQSQEACLSLWKKIEDDIPRLFEEVQSLIEEDQK